MTETDELDCKVVAEEGEIDTVEDFAAVVDNTAIELELDNTGGWFGLRHLDRESTSQRSLQSRIMSDLCIHLHVS